MNASREVKSLSEDELSQFRAWFVEFDWAMSDRQLERDARARSSSHRQAESDAAAARRGGVPGRLTGTRNRETMILGRKGKGALVFVVQSRQDDTFLRYVFNSVREAAKEQLSATRAGTVLVGLEGISADELVETAQQDKTWGERPTPLRIAVSEFLSGSTTDHVVGVGFMSRDELTPKAEGHVSSGGSVYHFPKTESRFWHNDFRGMFGEAE